MNALVAKEIRLLLPAYALALVLALAPLLFLIMPVWLLPGVLPHDVSTLAVLPFGFGVGLLALSCFGREFGLNTFALLMAQPLERRRIWWTKIIVLAGALATLVAIWALASLACAQPGLGWSLWRQTILVGATIAAIAFAGGLWTTLLLRQVVAAFWFSLLVPTGILMVVGNLGGTEAQAFAALGCYAAAGVALAWWQFRHIQDAMWTGGVVSLPGWRAAAASSRPSLRIRRPLAALFWKELQLQQVGLAAMAWLFVLHLGVVALRKYGHYPAGSGLRSGLEVFGGLWLIVPLLAGSPSVAEERKLGVTSAHLCLPFSSRVQFAIKLMVVLILGGLLSAFLLWSVEGIGTAIGAGGDIGGIKIPTNGRGLAILSSAFLGLALIGFYGSTLARHIVQALAIAVPTAFGVWLLAVICPRPFGLLGVVLWQGFLMYYVGLPILLVAFIWLSYGNFRCATESWQLWRRNLLSWAATLAFIFLSTAALYNRVWELLLPAEPARGPARLAGPASANPPRMFSYGSIALAALLPDGRLWVDRIWYDPGRLVLAVSGDIGIRVGGKWLSLSGNQIVPGSNWVEVTANFRDTVAIRADGTLWVSETPRSVGVAERDEPPPLEPGAPLVQFGQETNWQSVARDVSYEMFSVVLLKKDGTLWRWNPNHPVSSKEWKGLRSFEPHRLGTDSHWARLQAVGGVIYCWKRDGRAWALHAPPRDPAKARASTDLLVDSGLALKPLPALDNFKFRSLARCGPLHVAVREDGTLWAWDIRPTQGAWDGEAFSPRPPAQIGQGTDWRMVAGEWRALAALKTDGSLWEWHPTYDQIKNLDLAKNRPVRLGNHNDWVALGGALGRWVSLAADGSLWRWWYRAQPVYYAESDQPLLAPSRRPSRIENILGGVK